MSDQPATPPKPKVGSLRDRIAAFEKSASAAAPTPAPAPRPKPAGFATWKPKVPSPPSSPSAAATTSPDHAAPSGPTARAGGMSATDAKESITKAGSLKDRMAALQGKGAFGAPPPTGPKPAAEKPKWKPPPVVHAPVDDDNHSAEETTIAAAVERTLSPPTSIISREIHEPTSLNEGEAEPVTSASPPTAAVDDNADEAAADPEEEERQRRAAIAARMARLGGARVGMAPPVFGKKPPVRRPTQDETPAAEVARSAEDPAKQGASNPEITKSENTTTSPPAPAEASPVSPNETRAAEESRASPEYFPKRKNSENASVLSSESTDSHSIKTPASMPVPVVPRRAGPPRKRPAKSTAVVPDVPEEQPPVAKEHAALEQSASGEQTISLPQGPEHEALTEENASDLDTHDDPTPAPIIHAIPATYDAEKEDTESKQVYAQDTSEKLPSTVSPSVEEASGIASPSPSLAIDENEKQDDSVDDVDVEQMEELHIAADVPPAAHHHPTPFTEPSAIQQVDEKLLAEPVAAAGDDDKEDEAEEDARRRRIAERLANMGGVNPFAPSQVQSLSDEAQTPPVPLVSTTIHDDSTTSARKKSDIPLSSSPELESVAQADSTVESEADEDGGVYEDDNEPSRFSVPAELDEHHENVKATYHSHSPSVPFLTTHSSMQTQHFTERNDDDDGSEYEEDSAGRTPSPPLKPLSDAAAVPDLDTTTGQPSSSPPARPPQPPRRIIPQAPEASDDEEEQESDEEFDERLAQSQLFVPPPPGQRASGDTLPRRQFSHDEDGDGSENDAPALPVRQRQSIEVPTARSPSPSSDYNSEPESDHDGTALPILARNVSSQSSTMTTSPPPLPPTSPVVQTVQHDNDPKPTHHVPPIRRAIPPTPIGQPSSSGYSGPISPPKSTPTLPVSGSEEILDDEEGDPIDPGFHSPSSSVARTSPSGTPHLSSPPNAPLRDIPPPVPQQPDSDHDAEQLRRRTIAERMAKLGGIKFGAALTPTPAARPQSSVSPEEQEENVEPEGVETPTNALSEEEEERARKERIANKMAQMGGMRIGMMPMGTGALPVQPSHILRAANDAPKPALPPSAFPTRATPPSRRPTLPPPPPPAADTDSEYESAAASEDGVKVEAEESEPDEVDYADIGTPEEAPPPVPLRSARASHRQESLDNKLASPPIPPSRPPVPTSMPNRRSSVQTMRSMSSSAGGDIAQVTTPRKSSGFIPPHQSEYVMVEEPESQEALPPPARPTSRVPPMRNAPQVPQVPTARTASGDPSDSISSQWELPSIPVSALDFGGDADLSLSWTDAGAEHAMPASPPPPPTPAKRPPPTSELLLSADDLMALWGRVGVQVCEVATSIFEKSKKTLVGDGTYAGFVQAVLAMVPNAAVGPNAAGEYGYLVYMQNGPAVQKRASDIMPGDIVEIHDAKLKGHKGLQTYHQNVGGAGEALVGVVGEFEAKKTKIRVFHANQHVGQQTVESVSYRLEDLKSGLVKVYRVLEG
ncbi:hypothetical protein HYPSUDRAFT_208665 [Hypholoma sublateritium FD-334 SS-4]|uniref:BBC1/AIM3 cysteine proteinase-fold domain-containing protein n=1 Tax=Hypholoma sublateritium (strain FD-334 SS-4) TaxID=945553 RepID=A0A0D2ND05_HYPSF|nr:hypothetical protein HYPSUDRAFT_208665 [Hypholoma sublateritium FD-334 SS-4]